MDELHGLSAVQRAMYLVLQDGLPHLREELRVCLRDEYGSVNNIHAHLTAIRRALAPKGQTVVCTLLHRRVCYQRVGLLGLAAKRLRSTVLVAVKP